MGTGTTAGPVRVVEGGRGARRRRAARPSADGMSRHVASFTAGLTSRSRLPLDCSVESLRIVDVIIDGVRRGEPDRANVADVLFDLGAYAGEVLVRRAGAVWVDLDADQRELFGQPVGVRMPDGRVWNPLGKVVNRFELGPPESLYTFYLMLHGRWS